MKTPSTGGNGTRFLMIAASVVVVIAGMRAAQKILVPFLLAVFIAVFCMQPYNWLRRKHVPTVLALLMVIFGILGIGTVFLTLVGTSLDNVTRDLGSYQETLEVKVDDAVHYLQGKGLNLSDEVLLKYANPDAAMQLVANTLSGVGNILSNALLILLTVIFLLLEGSDIPGKLRAISGNADASFPQIERFLTNINRYMVIKTIVSLATGVLIGLWLSILGMDYPVLWGLLAFLLNYVPNIGSIIAAIPPILLALVQKNMESAVLIASGYLVVNLVIGNGIEPRFMGKGLGLSTLIVFLSLVCWGWILGPVGMFLSVPLTMTLKLALQSSQDTRWVAILLGGPIPNATVPMKSKEISPTAEATPEKNA